MNDTDNLPLEGEGIRCEGIVEGHTDNRVVISISHSP